VRPIYIGRAYRYPPDVTFYIYIFSTNISTEYFKHAAHSPFFSSKCRLFRNANFFWFLCYSHFTYRVCYNLNVKFGCQKINPTKYYPHSLRQKFTIIIPKYFSPTTNSVDVTRLLDKINSPGKRGESQHFSKAGRDFVMSRCSSATKQLKNHEVAAQAFKQ
jgi:hypothetical protein